MYRELGDILEEQVGPVHKDIQFGTRRGAMDYGPYVEQPVLVQAPEENIPGAGERIVVWIDVVDHAMGRQPQRPPLE